MRVTDRERDALVLFGPHGTGARAVSRTGNKAPEAGMQRGGRGKMQGCLGHGRQYEAAPF